MSPQLMLHVTLTLSETNSGGDGRMVGQAHVSDVEGTGTAGTPDTAETSVTTALAHIRAREDRKCSSFIVSE